MARLVRKVTPDGSCVNDTFGKHIHTEHCGRASKSKTNCAAWSPNGLLLAVTCYDMFYLVSQHDIQIVDTGPSFILYDPRFSPCGKFVVVCAQEAEAEDPTHTLLVNVSSRVARILNIASTDLSGAAVFSPDSRFVAFGIDRQVDIRGLGIAATVHSVRPTLNRNIDHKVISVAWSSNPGVFAVAQFEVSPQIHVYKFPNPTLLADIVAHNEGIGLEQCRNIVWHGPSRLAGLFERRSNCPVVRVWDVSVEHKLCNEVAAYPFQDVPNGMICCDGVLWTDGTQLKASIANCVYALRKGMFKRVFECRNAAVLAVSPDGKRVFTSRMEEWLMCPEQGWNEHTHAYYAQLRPEFAKRVFALMCVRSRLLRFAQDVMPFELWCLVVSFAL